ncbi:sulfate transport system ATP-binding protein [Andreprevotia lacus DSM 23236]|jgi:sulfate transport system ATP-binding protein|uniref:Sulfate transport system ATP-binding protein n=1 Tax=Andreprevotia lacus DSM 23236 TaxID=1121001 RepID=A0A1W1X1S8_9NEIS|nr:sulfate ABC transporter ATP-binding protein [Andreprevotia lacus]SMC17720.1 sulfate transport system ATP-binding protein [Andreprevotia lacus DSM 23236]
MSIEIKNISKQFGEFKALDNINLEVASGELLALLGPSGCGKTSLLRVIAGLETPDDGQILFHGEDATDTHVRERQVGFVFQHYALFRHMTVFENVAFGLRVRPKKTRPSEAEIKKRVHRLLELVQLDWLADRFPAQLSGGQRQRIALARALAVEPRVLLLDEPFGALDTKVRKELRRWLRRLHDEIHVTSVFVTHDQEEALEVADRVVVMNKGKIEQVGTPAEVYDTPASPFVYQFLGDINLFHSRVHDGWAEVAGARITQTDEPNAANATLYVRPHEIDLSRVAAGSSIAGVVSHIRLLGSTVRLEVEVAEHDAVEVELTRERYAEGDWKVGEAVWLNPREAKVYLAG